MASISNYLETALLDHSLGTSAYTAPTNVYVALFTTDPTDADTGTEVSTSGTNYDRKIVTFAAASTTGGDSTADSAGDVEFDEATASWGTITHIGLYDASTSGNLLWHNAVTTSKTVGTGDTVIVRAADMVVSID